MLGVSTVAAMFQCNGCFIVAEVSGNGELELYTFSHLYRFEDQMQELNI